MISVKCKVPSVDRRNEELRTVQGAFVDWKRFNDDLPDNSSNKTPVLLQGIVIKSQLCSHDADQCCGINKEPLGSSDCVNLIVNVVYGCEFMFLVSEAFEGLCTLLNTCCGQAESLKS